MCENHGLLFHIGLILILKSFDTNSIVSSIKNVASVKMWSALWKDVVTRKEIVINKRYEIPQCPPSHPGAQGQCFNKRE